jgi:hypothetical protein
LKEDNTTGHEIEWNKILMVNITDPGEIPHLSIWFCGWVSAIKITPCYFYTFSLVLVREEPKRGYKLSEDSKDWYFHWSFW